MHAIQSVFGKTIYMTLLTLPLDTTDTHQPTDRHFTPSRLHLSRDDVPDMLTHAGTNPYDTAFDATPRSTAENDNETEAVLLIHGLGGTRQDLGGLRSYLTASGVSAFDVLLPGHGGYPRDLAGIGYQAWLEAIEQRLIVLRAQYGIVHVVGLCMGALLALEAVKRGYAGSHPRGRLVLLSPPLFLDGWSLPWYRAIRHVTYLVPPLARAIRITETFPFGIKDGRVRGLIQGNLKRFERYHYPWVPLHAIRELDRLRKLASRDMDRVRRRTLIVHAIEDELTSINSALCLRDRINRGKPHPLAQLHVLSNSYHMICVDGDRHAVTRQVTDFLASESLPVVSTANH